MTFHNLAVLKQRWGRLSRREQSLLVGLVGLLCMVLAYTSIWQPTRQRLEIAERQHRQHSRLLARILRAEPTRPITSIAGLLSVRVNESAEKAGLDIAEMEVDDDLLRLAVNGDAKPLLHWLDQLERQGTRLQSLALEAENGVLRAQVVLRQ
ncbi:type II secretion system protein GspM [Pseudomonas sp. NR3]|uniref:type II secretion system protein GspM n=1 Tax=Pseudomonas sp. NR3 TaxID=3155978 RepID=UPI003B68296C